MSAIHGGVAKFIQKEETRLVYTHCYGHALNLAYNDMVKRLGVTCVIVNLKYDFK